MQKIIAITIMISSLLLAKGMHQGEVMETMNSAGYTYMKVSEGGKSYWIASNEINISKGADIAFSEEMSMHKFQSKTLNRTFENLMFVSEVRANHKEEGDDIQSTLKAAFERVKVSPYKTKDTLSVQEVFSQAKSLAGKTIKVRGKVTKVSEMVMQKNWIHIQDGTGSDKTNDIVFTSEKESASVGDIVTAEGVLALDKDVGAGYFYSVIIEKGSFTK